MMIRRYQPSDKETWDAFVSASRNGTFLFHRDYMDYHAERFHDHSLIVQEKTGQIIALLPANESEKSFFSHAGLTYGGFIIGPAMNAPKMLAAFEEVLNYLRALGFTHWVYKPVPHIYHTRPSEEDLYALFRFKARVYRRDVLTVIDYRDPLPYQERRRRSLRKARQNRIECRETTDYNLFWPILSDNLKKRYNLRPVHTVEEITLLAGRFPENIKLFGAYREDVMLAGAIIYLSRNVCHVQYNAASEEGKQYGTLDIVLDQLIGMYRSDKRYFDFGVSTEDNGTYLNQGLVEYKEGFGGRTIVHDLYELAISEYFKGVAP